MRGTTLIKKKMFWPKYEKSQETVSEMNSKEVGAIRVRKGSCSNGVNTNGMHLVALAHSKHTYVMLTNQSTEIKSGDTKKKKSRIGIGAI